MYGSGYLARGWQHLGIGCGELQVGSGLFYLCVGGGQAGVTNVCQEPQLLSKRNRKCINLAIRRR